nr:aminotransferase class III-fold pyridoxal phosphate-dependent enzyme [Rhodobacter sp.]
MTAAQVLEDLRRRGARVWSDQGELRISAPKGAVDKSLLDAASAQKATLIELLAPANAAGAMPPPDAPEAPDLIRLADVPDYRPDETPDFVRHVAPYRGFLYHMLGVDKTFVRGAGDWLYEADGTATADFVAQFGALPFGHDPNDIWKAVAAYRASGQPNLAISSIQPAAGSLAARLVDLAPEGLCHVTFANSGAEAVEIALKLAHCATGRPGILSFKNGFHGLTLGTMSATGDGFFQRGFGAPVLGFDYVPFGDLAALEALLAQRPQHFAAFLVEIIQGGGGMTTLPEGFLQAAQKLCRDYGVLLIIDEVQTGLGRTGRLFACEEEGVAPDILTLAKALGGGLVPVGACLFSAEVFREDFDLRHGSTFAGNALACHTGLATLELLTRDDRAVVRSAAAMGAHLRAGLEALQRKYPHLIAEIRGRGLMLGVVLTLDPIVERRAGLLAVLQQQNLLFNICVSYLLNQQHMRVAPSISGGTVLRIEPPLTVAPETCDALLSALETLLGVLDRADAGALLAHFMPEAQPGATRTAHPAVAATPRPAVQAEEAERFAFVAHLLSIDDLGRFDASLAGVGAAGLQGLRDRIKPFLRPFPMGQLQIDATTGRTARGETIILPHLPDELMAMSGDAAVALVDDAVRLAASRGAKVVGLGGFSS